uniref:Uncharacterized protein n=2 Tax=Steinernema glaseri TaxID=37863 RepID=A0A1I8AI31_9BILA
MRRLLRRDRHSFASLPSHGESFMTSSDFASLALTMTTYYSFPPNVGGLLSDDSCDSTLSEIPDFSLFPTSTPRSSFHRVTFSPSYTSESSCDEDLLFPRKTVEEQIMRFEQLSLREGLQRSPKMLPRTTYENEEDEDIYVEMKLQDSEHPLQWNVSEVSDKSPGSQGGLRRANSYHSTPRRPCIPVSHVPRGAATHDDFLPSHGTIILCSSISPASKPVAAPRRHFFATPSEFVGGEPRDVNLLKIRANAPSKSRKYPSILKPIRKAVRSICPLLNKKANDAYLPSIDEEDGFKLTGFSKILEESNPCKFVKSAEGTPLIYFDLGDTPKKNMNATY